MASVSSSASRTAVFSRRSAVGYRGRLFLLSLARFAQAENHVPAIAFHESVFCRHCAEKVFDVGRRKLHRSLAGVADEMEVIGLLDDSFVARHTGKFRLADHARSQKDLEGAIDRRNPDPMPLPRADGRESPPRRDVPWSPSETAR